MTATQAGTSTASSSGVPPGWQNVKNYGAVGNGSTDDSTAVQNAINYVKANGGVVYFPPGDYKIATTLNAKGGALPVSFLGPNCGKHFQAQKARLVYSGTTTGDQGGLLCFNGASGFEVAYLGLDYSNAAFTGDLVNIDGRGGVFADCQDFHIHHCGSWARTAITARSILRLSYAIIGTIDESHFTGAVNCIRLGDPGGGFIVQVKVDGCTFNNSTDAHILVGTGDGETIAIRDNTFEAGTNTPAIRGATNAVDGVGCQLYSPVISGNWFGDAVTPVTWIKGLGVTSNGFVGTIGPGNRFANPGGPTGVCLDNIGNWLVVGNSFDGGNAFASTYGFHGPMCVSNYFNGVFGTAVPPALIGNIDSSGGGLAQDGHYNRLAVRWETGEISAAVGFEALLLGASGNLEATGNAGAVYRSSPGGGNPLATVVQAPSSPSGDTREVQLVVGATPAAQVRVTKDAIGFYGHAPGTRGAAYTLNAGATARNLPAAGTVLDVEKTLRQLITDLQANGLLQ